jgi:hypothetical protein
MLDRSSKPRGSDTSQMAHTNHAMFRRLSGVALFAAILFLLLEVSARVYLFGSAGLIPARINSLRGLPQTGFTRPAAPDSGLVFELKPNIIGEFKLVPFQTNSQGLRDREYALEKPEGTYRVAVLGASFAFPSGVAIENAFHSLLEERLSEEFAPTSFEFINFAIGMYTPGQMLAMLEQRALAYDPDLILVTATGLSTPWMVNGPKASFRRANLGVNSESVDAFRKSYPILRSYFYRLLRQRLGVSRKSGGVDLGLLERSFMTMMDGGEPLNHMVSRRAQIDSLENGQHTGSKTAVPAEKSIIIRLARVGKSAGIPVLLVRLEFDASERLPIEIEAEELSRSHGVHYLDTRDAFEGTRPSDFWIHDFDPHPNRAAHEIFAREVSRYLHSVGLLSR